MSTKLIKRPDILPETIASGVAIKYMQSLTISDVVKIEPKTFLQIKADSEELAEDMVRLMLIMFMDRVNIRQKLAGIQIDELAAFIVSTYDILSSEDLHLILSRAEYIPSKPHYGTITKDWIIGEVNAYLDVKEIEVINYNKSKFKSSPIIQGERIPEKTRETKDIIKSIYAQLETKKKKPVVHKVKKDPLIKLMEDLVHFIIARGEDNTAKIAKEFNVSEDIANQLLKSTIMYSRKDSYGNVKTIFYDDIHAGFNPEKLSKFARLCHQILKNDNNR